jgi:putative redox protein
MATSRVIYLGNLRTKAEHLQSGETILTDAPKDNQGMGEAFSPTDLLATSLASCMLTIMGIAAKARGIDLSETEAEVIKVMTSDPRRVSEINIRLGIRGGVNLNEKEKEALERAALTCPVWYSLHPDIKKNITWEWK